MTGALGKRRAILTTAAIAGFVALSVPACEKPEPPPVPPPPRTATAETVFEDPVALLDAIEEGTFAEETGLHEELRVPEPVRVDFDRGSEVPASERPKLEDLAREIVSNERIRLDVVGCSDPPGSARLNQRISQSRAESVARALRELGVPSERIREVVGRGESCLEPERMVRVTSSLVGQGPESAI